MASQFSSDGKYFAQITTDGKLKVWDAASGSFEQEFVPDFHLTSPCTCLHFVERLESGDKVGGRVWFGSFVEEFVFPGWLAEEKDQEEAFPGCAYVALPCARNQFGISARLFDC